MSKTRLLPSSKIEKEVPPEKPATLRKDGESTVEWKKTTVAKLTRVAEIQDEQGNQQGNVENVVVQPD